MCRVILALLCLVGCGSVVEAVEGPQARVVVLHSYHDGFSWSDSLSQGIREQMLSQAPEADLRFEYLDTRFKADAAYLAAAADALAVKYHDRTVDVVIACDDNALTFMVQAGMRAFPEAPLVFCSVSGFREDMLATRAMTGLRESIDIKGTITSALRQRPDCDEIAVILDDSRTGEALKAKTEQALADLAGCPPRRYLSGLTVDQLKTRLPELSSRAIVLVVIFPPDASGRVLSHEQNLARIRPYCAAPIYAVWQFYLGHGIRSSGEWGRRRPHGSADGTAHSRW
ncbi:MAG: hypothetical protein PF961_13910 [Planctomycetota bacterium]|jgi:hypothetical protein|nr:hypothetical protein [Planctomycetota bacterium]